MTARVLVVDDDAGMRQVLADGLQHFGFEVESVESAEDALGRVKAFDPSVVITDLRMPGMDGLQLLGRVKESMDGVDVIVMTGHEDMSSAVSAMKAGAFDYLVKPVDLKDIRSVVERCLAEQELNRNVEVSEQGEERTRDAVVGRDPRMIEIYKLIGVLARNRATVLVRGETGTGKEMVAQAIHVNSAHAEEPFIAVNCTALTDSLLESELFGHVRGAFTGAVSGRRGYFELAGSGTIFLDEIGDTSPDFQSKLLRVLQERQFYPVGGEAPRQTEARVIAATHQPIEELVQQGRFRQDLYFRLKVVEVHIPPLRERVDDIPLLAEALLERIRAEVGQDVRQIAPEAMKELLGRAWPGNVRELENVLTRGAILARGSTLGLEHLPAEGVEGPLTAAGATGSWNRPLGEIIVEHVDRVLAATGGNKSEAARVLGISRSRLARILKKGGDE